MSTDSRGLYERALVLHRASKLEQAVALYREHLQEHPKHADSWCMLGTLLLQIEDLNGSEQALKTAIQYNPEHVIAHANLGRLYHDQGKVSAAKSEYMATLNINPSFSDVLNNYGCLLREEGDYESARNMFNKLIDAFPNYCSAYFNIGLNYSANDDWYSAITNYQQAIACDPNYDAAYYQLANAYRELGNDELAVELYYKILPKNQLNSELLSNLGVALQRLGNYEESLLYHQKSLQINPNSSAIQVNVGSYYSSRLDYERSLPFYQKAIDLDKNSASAYTNLANALCGLQRLSEAEQAIKQALRINPTANYVLIGLANLYYNQAKYVEAAELFEKLINNNYKNNSILINFGSTLYHLNRFNDAIELYDSILAQSPELPIAHWNRAIALLASGQIDQGWQEWRWGIQSGHRKTLWQHLVNHIPLWLGEPLDNKKLLIYLEQGVADEILFYSCLPDLHDAGHKLIVICDRRLVDLLQRSMPRLTLYGISREEKPPTELPIEIPPFDYQVPVGELPVYLRKAISNFPKNNQFLVPNSDRSHYWRKRLESNGRYIYVGLTWRSGLRNRRRDVHYIELTQMLSIFRIDGVKIVNLQYDITKDEIDDLSITHNFEVITFPEIDLYNDLDESCALISALDIVIAPDVLMFNLAAGMGIPTWGFRPYAKNWEQLGLDYIPWYPNARIFQQTTAGDWDSVVDRICSELELKVEAEFDCHYSNRSRPRRLGDDLMKTPQKLPQTSSNNNIDELFSNVLAYHQRGELDAAELGYREILALDPEYVNAHSLLGALLLQRGQLDAATHSLKQALVLQPNNQIARSNYGHLLHEQGDLDAAIREYRTVLSQNPDFVDAENNLGCALRERGDFSDAEIIFKNLIARHPDYCKGYYNLGLTQYQSENTTAAIASYRQAIACQPQHAESHQQLANLLAEQQQNEEAINHYQHALTLQPHNAELYFKLATLQMAMDALEAALTTYQTAQHYISNNAQLWSEVANLHILLGQYEAAEHACKQSLAIDPDFLMSRMQRTIISYLNEDAAAAANDLVFCLQAQPENSELMARFAAQLYQYSQPAAAVAVYRAALTYQPDSDALHSGLATALLANGELQAGWREWDWGLEQKRRSLATRYAYPIWPGTHVSLQQQTILVYAEQGIGDEVMFSSCLPDLINQAGQVIIQCEPRLESIFQRSFPTAWVHGGDREEPATWLADTSVDWQSPIGSIAGHLRPVLSKFPNDNAFLIPDPERCSQWQQRLNELPAGLRVGLAWRSQLRNRHRDRSYLSIMQLEPILKLSNVQFVNLQYGDCGDELAEVKQQYGVNIINYPELDLYNDIEGGCALMSQLDLIICPTTAIDMGAATGTPTWMFTGFGSPWSQLGTKSFPWYPAVEVFQQIIPNDWSTVVVEMCEKLKLMLKNRLVTETEPPSTKNKSGKKNITSNKIKNSKLVGRLLDRAITEHKSGNLETAEQLYFEILQHQPKHADAINLLGAIAEQRGNYELAAEYFETSVSLSPKNALYHYNLALSKHRLGAWQDAQQGYRKALQFDPDMYNAAENLATLLILHSDNLEEAYQLLQQVERRVPERLTLQANMAELERRRGNFDKSEHYLQQLFEQDPHNADGYNTYTAILVHRGEYEAALAICNVMLERNQADPTWLRNEGKTQWNRGFALLALGDLTQGWDAYDYGITAGLRRSPTYPATVWQGENLPEQHLLVTAEQGIGDQLLFASCLPDLLKCCPHITLECEPRLKSLLHRSFPSIEMITTDQPLMDNVGATYKVAIGSLPRYLRRSLATFPSENCYLKPDQTQSEIWRQRLQALGPGIRVGIAWRSKHQNAIRNASYLDISQLAPLLILPNIQFINLQYDQCESELNRIKEQLGVEITDFPELDLLNDIDGSAALMAVLDLVICPFTTTCSIAAGVGTPTWIFTKYEREWDTFATDDYPWFPSAKIFRQPEPGAWEPLIDTIKSSLQALSTTDKSMLEEILEATADHESKPATQVTTPDGELFIRDHNSPLSEILRAGNHFSPGETKLLKSLIKPGQTVIDVGAHIGEMTLSLARAVTATGEVWAFEGDRDNFYHICGSMALNEIENAYIESDSVCGMPKTTPYQSDSKPLDDWSWPRCDLIRLSREVEPLSFIAGAEQTLRLHHPFLVIESIETDAATDQQPLIQKLQDIGYQIIRQSAELSTAPDSPQLSLLVAFPTLHSG